MSCEEGNSGIVTKGWQRLLRWVQNTISGSLLCCLCRGFDKEKFKMVLQSWCLFTKISLEIMAQWMETALDVPGVQLSPEVRAF